MASITFVRGTEMRLQIDEAKKECPFKYKTAIMLLHIHKFLLRAYHSMQSTLPYRHGSRGGHYNNSGRRQLSRQLRMKKASLDQCDGDYKLLQDSQIGQNKINSSTGASLQKAVTSH